MTFELGFCIAIFSAIGGGFVAWIFSKLTKKE